MHHAVVVDDDEAFLSFVTLALAKNGFFVTPCNTGRDLLRHLAANQPDIVFLDRLLPDINGFVLCEKIKLRDPQILLMMFSSQGEDQDIIQGLELGADDYLPKPFPAELLIARVKALFRRRQPRSLSEKHVFGDLVLDKKLHQVTLDGQILALTKTEFRFLDLFMDRADELVAYEDLFKILGYDQDLEEARHVVFFHVGSLRKKLGPYRSRLTTVRGYGYKFCSADPEP